MSTVVDAAFVGGDFVVARDKDGNSLGDFVLVMDSAAVAQTVLLVLSTQLGANQYFPGVGWDWMRWQGAALSDDDIEQVRQEVRATCERVAFVRRAQVSYLGYEDGEFSFSIELDTTFGTTSVDYTLGGSGVQL